MLQQTTPVLQECSLTAPHASKQNLNTCLVPVPNQTREINILLKSRESHLADSF